MVPRQILKEWQRTAAIPQQPREGKDASRPGRNPLASSLCLLRQTHCVSDLKRISPGRQTTGYLVLGYTWFSNRR